MKNKLFLFLDISLLRIEAQIPVLKSPGLLKSLVTGRAEQRIGANVFRPYLPPSVKGKRILLFATQHVGATVQLFSNTRKPENHPPTG